MKFVFRAKVAVFAAAFCFVLSAFAAQRQVAPRRDRNAAAKSAEALDALYLRSDPTTARKTADAAVTVLRASVRNHHPSSGALLDALFIKMEAAALQADTRAELEAALQLSASGASTEDARVGIATSTILDLAGNTAEFRAAVPRIQTLLTTSLRDSSDLRAALLAAASDGVPGLSQLELARQSGLVTDWRIVGPLGDFPNVAFEQTWPPEQDLLVRNGYGGHQVEQFSFANGEVVLPDYFSVDGVFYAAAQVTSRTAGAWRLRVESPGTIQTWVDGNLVVTKDDRFETSPETIGATVTLGRGKHTVLVKFVSAAAPFRVALLPPATRSTKAVKVAESRIDPSYLKAVQAFWAGDYAEAVNTLSAVRVRQESANVDLALAQALSRSGGSAPEIDSILQSALKLSPSGVAAAYERAALASAQGKTEDAFRLASGVIHGRPAFEPAVHLAASTATRLRKSTEAEKAWTKELQLHPSCAVLKDAASFFESVSDLERTREIEAKLQGCAPGSLDWAEALSKSGHHQQAATAARAVVTAYPLDRRARELLVRELTLSGTPQPAREAAAELVALAPNSAAYRRMAEQLAEGHAVLDSNSADEAEREFYLPFRRDGIAVVRETSNRRSYGGQSVLLLNDRVVRVGPNGEGSVYVHTVRRILDRDALAKFGEVSVPSAAEILELRTIKADGSIVEPELTHNKSTITMSGLAPGDAVDVEYVIRELEGGLADDPNEFEFTFGSFSAPMISSRFVVVSAPQAKLKFVPFGHVPDVDVRISDVSVSRIWEASDISQSGSEASTPSTGNLPRISVLPEQQGGWAGVRDFYREEFIDAVHTGSRIEHVAHGLSGATDEERLRAAYRFVSSRIKGDADYGSGEISSAESTLRDFSGSRTAALLALGKAMGIPAEVLMARRISVETPVVPSIHSYTHPLLLLHLRDGERTRDVVLDAETEGMDFGGVAARLERRDALIVPVYEPSSEPVIAAVPTPVTSDRSVAEGDVRFDENGDLTAHLVIRMGAARGAQMRKTLSTVEPADRKRFFEQLAGRIFSGISYAEGKVENEFDTDNPLTLVVDCRASRFVNFGSKLTELNQLVPALGLKSMYSTESARLMPLMIEPPLIESTTFRIQLPPGYSFLPSFNDFEQHNDFGKYAVTLRSLAPGTVELRREFEIPAQIVEPRRFSEFASFARRVDDAERQRLEIRRSRAAESNTDSGVN